MRPLLLALATSLLLGGCGDDSVTLSEPLAPVTTPLVGSYDLTVVPDPDCGLGGPYTRAVSVTTLMVGGRSEIRATLPSGDATLALEMLYTAPGVLRGSVATREPVLFSTTLVFLRAVGTGVVSLGPLGRPEIAEAPMTGDVGLGPDGASLTCASSAHRFSLLAR